MKVNSVLIQSLNSNHGSSINFFSQNVFRVMLMIFIFTFFRFYLFFNLAFPQDEIKIFDVFMMFFWGIRYDLCVSGFILMPIYILFCFSLFVKNKFVSNIIFLLGHSWSVGYLILVTILYFFNLPFLLKNSAFDWPYWMRIEDIKSIWDFSYQPNYWQFGYVDEIQFIHILLFLCVIVYSTVYVYDFPKLKMNNLKLSLFVCLMLIVLMARGKFGQHHLRYEDSRFSSVTILNELAINPLWLIDKSKEHVSQEHSQRLKSR